jgi:AcrR family transcriptional regulator
VKDQWAAAPATTRTRRRRGPSKGDLKEAAILETAWQLLADKPLTSITVEDLAQAAGISRSSFYFYFPSKEAVVTALTARVADDIRLVSAAFFQGPGRTAADLRQSITAYLAQWHKHGRIIRAVTAAGQGGDSLHRFGVELIDPLLDEAAAAIERERQAGILAPGPPAARDLVRVLHAMLWRTGYETSLRPLTRAEQERLVDTLTTVILRASAPTTSTTQSPQLDGESPQ